MLTRLLFSITISDYNMLGKIEYVAAILQSNGQGRQHHPAAISTVEKLEEKYLSG